MSKQTETLIRAYLRDNTYLKDDGDYEIVKITSLSDGYSVEVGYNSYYKDYITIDTLDLMTYIYSTKKGE